MIDVAANWQRVSARVAQAAIGAGREPQTVRIIAVSKIKPVELIEQAIAAGATDVGENYVQEAAEKIRRIARPVTWHMIGHLQRNKAGRAVELFDVIHTLDSTGLADALTRHGERRGRPVRVLIEVNTGGELTKSGVPPDGVEPLLTALAEQRWLIIDGLMTVPPAGRSAERARVYFRLLRTLRDRLQVGAPANAPLHELSMGMSDDFTVAIEEGATMVRIGRAIFGER
ncbi:MAG TPA: YggS family pyridoxal phosphate-dependent enzyme [Candidatus Acidoferrales bacterium]|nr:YggS family pyridoxal phosphate-dependent enzyme [Candidatus Acidoferrales bacterium]